MTDDESNETKEERIKRLGEYVRGVSIETMNFIHAKMTSDKGSADPYVGAHIAGLAAIYLLHMATKDESQREDFINELKKAIKEVDEDDAEDDDILALKDGQFVCLTQSSTVH